MFLSPSRPNASSSSLARAQNSATARESTLTSDNDGLACRSNRCNERPYRRACEPRAIQSVPMVRLLPNAGLHVEGVSRIATDIQKAGQTAERVGKLLSK